MNKYSSKGAQGGFTLIELIVVIVILGILAATALPKFASLSGDARAAALQAAKGSLNSTASIYHAKWLINPSVNTISVEGTDLGFTNGYPTANAAFATVAGLSTDDYYVNAGGGVLTIAPAKLTAAQRTECKLTYTNAVAGAAPDVKIDVDKCE